MSGMHSLVDTSDRILGQAALGVVMSALVFVISMFVARHHGRAATRLAAGVAFSYGAFFVQPMYQWFMVLCSCALSISALRQVEREEVQPQSDACPSKLQEFGLFTLALLPVVGLLLYRLGTFSPTVLNWEGTTIDGLLERLRQDLPLGQVILTFSLWNDGTLSAGETSLLFGLPALLLSREFGLSIVLLRAISAFWMVGAIIIFALLFRRGFGRLAPYIAVLVFGLNEAILVYGRYGSSISGTMFSLVLAVLLSIRLMERADFARAFFFCLAIYVATLGYAAARISVLILLLVTALTILRQAVSYRRKFGVYIIMLVTIGAIFSLQKAHDRQDALLRARMEQIFYVTSQSHPLFPSEVFASRGATEAPFSWGERVRVAQDMVLKSTGPQLLKILNPFSSEQRSRYPFKDDPPFIKIFAPALFPWMLLGFWAVWFSGRRCIAVICMSLVALGIVPLLLTNRVDSYRSIFLTIPFSIWITVGLVEFMRIAGRLRASKALIYVWLMAGLIWGIMPRRLDLYAPHAPIPHELSDVMSVVHRVSGPVSLLITLDHQVESMIGIELFKRVTNTGVASDLLADAIATDLTNNEIFYRPASFERVVDLLKEGRTAVLAPAALYKIAAGKLRQRGYVVRTSGAPRFSVFAVSPPEIGIGLGIAPDRMMPSVQALEPLTQPQPFTNHHSIELTSLQPISTHYDFAAPQNDRTFSGVPAGWRNLRFTHWLGTHATTTVEYGVPEGAEGFQSWIGISPGVESCLKGSAQVIIRDQNDQPIYISSLLRADRDPVFLSIPVRGVSRLRIHVSDAGDNRDCDHVDFGDPAFMIPKQ
jgi:hypothetical protein